MPKTLVLWHENPGLIEQLAKNHEQELAVKAIPIIPHNRFFANVILSDHCSNCIICEGSCPNLKLNAEKRIMVVNPVACRGCGVCLPSCPTGALQQRNPRIGAIDRKISSIFDAGNNFIPSTCNQCPVVSSEVPDQTGGSCNIRLSCTGRFEPALALDSFAKGFKGILIVGCLYEGFPFEKNRYVIEERIEFTKELMKTLGLDEGRIVYVPTVVSKGGLVNSIMNLQEVPGGTTKVPSKGTGAIGPKNKTDYQFCVDCGKCTVVCPVAQKVNGFSPRRIVETALSEPKDETPTNRFLWDCLTCGKCSNYCPKGVTFHEFVRSERASEEMAGLPSILNHGGITYSIAKTMAELDVKQERLDWVGDAKVSEKGDVLLFTGCMVYFDTIFDHLKIGSKKNILYNAVKILNRAGIVPAVMPDEVCCGHDLLFSGDTETFKKLMQKNILSIKRTGAKRIVTVCPEGTLTLKKYYAEYGGLDLDVVHISELISELLKSGKLKLRAGSEKVTYHDPCRLVHHLRITEAPREVIEAISPAGFVEMKDNKDQGTCCGTSLFRGCDAISEQMRYDRLRQAMETEATSLLTSCPKCQIHFKCTLSTKCEENGLDPKFVVKDLVTFVAEHLDKEG